MPSTDGPPGEPPTLLVISDFICPWCYVGLTEVERLRRDYPALRVKWGPFFLDPSIPPEGRTRAPMTAPGDPPSHLELRGERNGITFTRGRTFIPNSHLALETAQFAEEHGHDGDLHARLFRAHFTEMANLGEIDTLVRIGTEAGLDGDALRAALMSGAHRDTVDQRIEWAYSVGVSAVPTFIFNEQYAIVGAEEYTVFQRMMERLGYSPPPGADRPPAGMRITFPGDSDLG